MLESYIEQGAIKRAKECGFICRKVQWIGRRGAPDRLFSRADTGPFFVEFKAPGKTLDPHQIREIAKLRAAGLRVHVVDSLVGAHELFA